MLNFPRMLDDNFAMALCHELRRRENIVLYWLCNKTSSSICFLICLLNYGSNLPGLETDDAIFWIFDAIEKCV
jgi:hypothetical protein